MDIEPIFFQQFGDVYIGISQASEKWIGGWGECILRKWDCFHSLYPPILDTALKIFQAVHETSNSPNFQLDSI